MALIFCLPVFLWLGDSEHTQPIWFNKGRKQTVTEPWETADRGWRRVKLISHMMWCGVWGGGEALRVKRSGNSYSTWKIDVNVADLCCSVTFGGKDNILAFHPFCFLTLGRDFIVSFFTAVLHITRRWPYVVFVAHRDSKQGSLPGLLLLQGQKSYLSTKTLYVLLSKIWTKPFTHVQRSLTGYLLTMASDET